MIAFIEGKLIDKKPTESIIKTNSVGFLVYHSVITYEKLPEIGENIMLHTVLLPKEDSLNLYGFHSNQERETFKLLITVNGIGPKSAISILSSIESEQLINIIQENNPRLLKKIPSIGPKTAERIILELKDKIKTISYKPSKDSVATTANFDEATEALVVLGFSRSTAEKAVVEIIKESPSITSVEEIIKLSLKKLIR